jgi:transcriptional regulator with XRE-family HTH domain
VKEISNTFGARLRLERARLGFSQSQLGALLGVAYQSVGTWETGKFKPDSEKLTACASLGMDINFVMTGVRLDEATRATLQRAAHKALGVGSNEALDEYIYAQPTLNDPSFVSEPSPEYLSSGEAELLANYRRTDKPAQDLIRDASAAIADGRPKRKS